MLSCELVDAVLRDAEVTGDTDLCLPRAQPIEDGGDGLGGEGRLWLIEGPPHGRAEIADRFIAAAYDRADGAKSCAFIGHAEDRGLLIR